LAQTFVQCAPDKIPELQRKVVIPNGDVLFLECFREGANK